MRHAQTRPTGATTPATSAGLAAFRRTERTRFASTPFGFGSVSKSSGGGGGAGGAQARRLSVRWTPAPGAPRSGHATRRGRAALAGLVAGGARPRAAQATKATATAAATTPSRRRRGGTNLYEKKIQWPTPSTRRLDFHTGTDVAAPGTVIGEVATLTVSTVAATWASQKKRALTA